MRYTLFAGLTQLDPLDPLSTDDYSFQDVNPDITDRLLEVGAITHRHDGHPALADPAGAPSCVAVASGGQIPGGVSIQFAYTLVDADRGETLASPLCTVSTPAIMGPPEFAPSGVPNYSAGSLTGDAYYYATTWVDGGGGETTLGAIGAVDVDPAPNAQVFLSRLASGMPAGAVAWRLYRARGGENFHYLASGASDTLTDDGTLCASCQVFPPEVNSTQSNSSIEVTIPAVPSGAAGGWRLYARTGNTWQRSSFMASGAAAGVQTFTTFAPSRGRPPNRSLALRGAHMIDPDTELIDWHWKRPVQTSADLVALTDNEDGDVRVVKQTRDIWIYTDNGGWQMWQGGGGTSEGPGSGTAILASGAPIQFSDAVALESPMLGEVDDVYVFIWIEHPDMSNTAGVLYPPGELQDGVVLWQQGTLAGSGLGGDPDGFPVTDYCYLMDEAATPLTAGISPRIGEYRPFQALKPALRGKVGGGTWTLQVVDFTTPGDGFVIDAGLVLVTVSELGWESHTFAIQGPVASGMPIPGFFAAMPENVDSVTVRRVLHKLASGHASVDLSADGVDLPPYYKGVHVGPAAGIASGIAGIHVDDFIEPRIAVASGGATGLTFTIELETKL